MLLFSVKHESSKVEHPTEVIRRGFALVVTLSLMVLLTIVAVGLLTLSSISLRASGQGAARAVAQANARLALMMALGDLQKIAGPDQRITARADMLDAKNPRYAGAWESWEIRASPAPQAADYQKSAKDAKFKQWLVSSADPQAAHQTSFAGVAAVSPQTLWGKGSLGDKAPAESFVHAGKVPIQPGRGALAWAVLDEGVKARIDTPYSDSATSIGLKTTQLGAGERPGVEFIAGLKTLERKFYKEDAPEFAGIGKGISRLNFSMAGEQLAAGVGEALKPLAHDVTTHSVGLFTDVARGGLKQDFHLLANGGTLPAEYTTKGVYVSRLGMTPSEATSDPRWESFHQFSRLYRDKVTNSAGVPVVKIQAPAGWKASSQAGSVTTVNRKPPPGVVLMPTIAKVQMLFSLIVRDLYNYPAFPIGTLPPLIPETALAMHGPQDAHFRGTKYDYDLHLLYTPIVTLHNPYNVAIDLSNLRLEFLHVPFALQIFRNGIAQSTGLVPLDTMYADNQNGTKGKIFGMNLKTKSNGRPGATTFRLLPGEVKLFSPYIDPNRSYRTDLADRKFWDIFVSTGITNNIDAIPGWRGDGIGFDLDWITGNLRINGNKAEGRWESCLGVARDDEFHVLFAPLTVPGAKNKFIIQMAASTGSSANRTVVNAIEMDYESPTGLQEFILGKGNTVRYPKSGTVNALTMLDHSTTPIKDILNVKPFALLSAQAKSTSGGRDASNEDGRLATKPWCFAHANIGASSQKVVSEHSANHSHEIDLQLLEKGTANLLQIDPQDRGNFITGHTGFNGTKFGSLYDIPLAPIQTFAGLNGTNPGGSSGYLPRFARPIGNSWAHPLMSPDKCVQSSTTGNYLDHSFLLNLALYDSYYFSGLADQGGAFGSGRATASLADAFAAGGPLDDPRLVFQAPDGQPASDFANVVKDPAGHGKVAAWQTMRGAFNINSTSVAAWKAMLASVHDAQALVNLQNPASGTSSLSDLESVGDQEARISRFRLPASNSAADGADPRDGYWLGPREFTDAELQTLAENIVKQVRLRGPFLSLAEFVNRRLGSDETAQRGALQQAIDDSNLNKSLAVTANAGFEIGQAQVADYKYANPAAGAGPSYQGAPGFLSQSDILSVLANAATARSDTFTIRAYGEARDAAGKTVAAAICEAVVQRTTGWLDPADPVETAPSDLTSKTNQTFGRRFVIVSFRWLDPKEA